LSSPLRTGKHLPLQKERRPTHWPSTS
jgi:hypothetical protein